MPYSLTDALKNLNAYCQEFDKLSVAALNNNMELKQSAERLYQQWQEEYLKVLHYLEGRDEESPNIWKPSRWDELSQCGKTRNDLVAIASRILTEKDHFNLLGNPLFNSCIVAIVRKGQLPNLRPQATSNSFLFNRNRWRDFAFGVIAALLGVGGIFYYLQTRNAKANIEPRGVGYRSNAPFRYGASSKPTFSVLNLINSLWSGIMFTTGAITFWGIGKYKKGRNEREQLIESQKLQKQILESTSKILIIMPPQLIQPQHQIQPASMLREGELKAAASSDTTAAPPPLNTLVLQADTGSGQQQPSPM